MIYYILNIKRKKFFIQGLILDYFEAQNKYRQKQLRFVFNICLTKFNNGNCDLDIIETDCSSEMAVTSDWFIISSPQMACRTDINGKRFEDELIRIGYKGTVPAKKWPVHCLSSAH